MARTCRGWFEGLVKTTSSVFLKVECKEKIRVSDRRRVILLFIE